MTRLKHWILALLFTTSIGGGALAVASPSTALAACDDRTLLTLPTWYRGLVDNDCEIKNPNEVGGISNFIWRIVLNIIEIALHLVGYISVVMIIFAGFTYIVSTGSPDKAAKARKTILNAVIGLVLSMASIAIVNVIVGIF